ncbi:MAG: aldehyde dehydrogenase [Cellvibrionales bacterium]|nr:aldehyde dehydrogenase [Cellvibrionales bacterium]
MKIANLSALRATYRFAVPELVSSRIHGNYQDKNASAEHLPIIYPASGEQVALLQEADKNEVEQAVGSARQVFASGIWADMPVAERQAILRRGQRLIIEHQKELAFLECLNAGLPMYNLQSRQVPRAAENFGFFADYIGQMAGETFEQLSGYLSLVTRQPAGVAALLAPWNAPLALASMQIASAIAFGNSCVLKPSEHTPLAIGRMVELLEQAGLPPGVVNVLNGRGHISGQALVAHPGIDRIAFTGGTATAKTIMANAAANLTPVHLELGGKSANIIFDDADFESALDGSLLGAFGNNGQMCLAGSRILVQRNIAGRFIEAFIERTKNLRVGDPMDPTTEIGPLAFESHARRVAGYVDIAVAEGAVLLAGGAPLDGCFFQPTVVQVESNRGRVCQEEIFGPFVVIQVFDQDAEALAIANDSEYGLACYVWTANLSRALAMQRKIQAGTVWINTSLMRDLRAPFGGFKNSGIGRDGSRQCAEFYSEEKSTVVARGAVQMRKLGVGD